MTGAKIPYFVNGGGGSFHTVYGTFPGVVFTNICEKERKNIMKTTKRILSMLLALTVVLSVCAVPAFADEETTTDYEAKIGDVCYTTLQEAVNRGTSKSTSPIVLQKDIDLKAEPLVIGTTSAIDLNGKKITRSAKNADSAKNKGAIQVEMAKKLTITDTSSDKSGVIEVSDTNLKIAAVYNSGTVLFKGGTIKRNDDNTFGYYTVVNETVDATKRAELNISGSKIINNSKDSSLIHNDTRSRIYVFDGAVASNGFHVIKNEGNATLIINGGEFNAKNEDALAVMNYGTATIRGGKFSNKVASYLYADEDELAVGKTTITGGSFTGVYAETHKLSKPEYENGQKPTMIVKSGTFTEKPADEYISEGSSVIENGDGTYTVGVIPIAEVNGVKYTDLTKARDAAKNGVLKLLADFDEPNKTTSLLDVGNNYTMTLDLNGHTMRAAGGYGVICVNEGTLTIEGDGKIIAVESYNSKNTNAAMAVYATNGGKVIINDSSFSQEITGNDSQYDLIYTRNGATVEINGGTFKSETPKWTLNKEDKSESTITVKGGTFIGYDPAYAESESPVANFVAEGYKSVSDGNGNYTVQKKSEQVKLFDQIVVLRGTTPWLFAAVDSLKYGKAGFELTVGDKTETVEASIVCDSVTSNGETKSAEDLGGKYLFGIQLKDTYRNAFSAVPFADSIKGSATYFAAATSNETSAE